MAVTPEQTVQDLAHLAFCALVALRLADQDGLVASPLAEHLFLTRWLATAQKQKRFPKTVAIDIQLLLDKGRTQGVATKLGSRLQYLWRSCSGDLQQQSDLFRLTHTLEGLKAQGWRNELVTSAEWEKLASDEVPACYVVKASLTEAFSNKGKLLTPLEFKITGDVQPFVDALALNQIKTSVSGEKVTLIP